MKTLQSLSASALLLGLAAGAGCAPDSRSVSCRPLGSTAPAKPNPAFSGTVFTIVLENHGFTDLIASGGPTYINQLASQYASDAGYYGEYLHPSEPNYLWMVAGENFGVTNDNDPINNHVACTEHLADQIERAGLTWRSYQESLGSDGCGLVSAGNYAAKHNPFVFFEDINGWNGSAMGGSARCMSHVVDYSQLAKDLAAGTVPRYAFITPNLQDDMHDGTIEQADAWLAQEVPKILASPAWKNGGVLFILGDEGSLVGHENPPFLAISPLAKKGYSSQLPYTTSSFLKTVQTMLGLETLPCDPAPDAVSTMDDLFTVPIAGK